MEHHGRWQVIDKADGLMKVRGVCGGVEVARETQDNMYLQIHPPMPWPAFNYSVTPNSLFAVSSPQWDLLLKLALLCSDGFSMALSGRDQDFCTWAFQVAILYTQTTTTTFFCYALTFPLSLGDISQMVIIEWTRSVFSNVDFFYFKFA